MSLELINLITWNENTNGGVKVKGKELIELIKENELEDFEIETAFTDGFSTFPNVRKFKIERIDDIGYSSEIAILGIKEKD